MSQTIESIHTDFENDGYAVARGLFTADEVGEIRETFMEEGKNGPVEGLSDMFRGKFAPGDPLSFYPRMMHPHRHPNKPIGQVALRYMLHPKIYEPLKRLMNDEPAAAQSMFYFKPAGARGQELHQDNFYLRVAPDTCYAMWLAIDDADEENGTMMVVPGTHNMDIVCPEKADPTLSFSDAYVAPPSGKEPVLVPLQAGDVLFFNGSLIHGSRPNRSQDRFRRAFICHYLPASSVELSRWYTEPLLFDGSQTAFADAVGGGPCGAPTIEVKGPH
ncbi:MAG: phytanoyl-CoA dioxygenase family protein [Armatimonadaceae bacterium]